MNPLLRTLHLCFVPWVIFVTSPLLLHAAPPPGWTAQTIGSPTIAGTVDYNATTGQTTASGRGHVIDGTADKFQFIHQPLVGDGEIITRVASMTNTASYPRTAIMLRTSLEANSAHVILWVSNHDGYSFGYRQTNGASYSGDSRVNGSAPIWLKLARLGQRVTAFRSMDGVVWTNMGSIPATMTLPSTLYAGLAVTSNDSNGGAVATVTHLALRQSGAAPTEATTSLIGSGISAGAVSANGANAYVLGSNGGNLGGATPGLVLFHRSFTGDGEISARVTSFGGIASGSSIGLMIRDSVQPEALYASIAITPNGVRRKHINGVGENPVDLSSTGVPVLWLKMRRHGVLFSAFTSSDGLTWQPVGKAFAIPISAQAQWGLTMVGAGNSWDTGFAQASVDQVAWPQAAPTPPALDPVIAAGLVAWRKPDGNGIRCVDCHTPFAYDLAQFNFTRADVRLATTPHLSQTDADAIFDMIEMLRLQYPPAGGLKDFRTFRPLQPGGGQIVGGESATANERDAAFGFYLRDHFKLGQGRIVTLAQARAAAQELIDVNVTSVPVGFKFNLFSRSVLREGAVTGGEIAEWLPSVGIQPKPAFADYWFSLQDAYLRDPSNENFWAIYHASNYWTDLDTHNFVAGSTHGNWRYVVTSQFLANNLFIHDELLKARGLPAQLTAEDGVRPFPAQRGISTVELAPFWNVGDNARVVQNQGFTGFPRRNKESVSLDLSYNSNLGEVSGWQVQDFRLPWFWMGWAYDNSLRFSGEGSTLSGEYFIGSLWSGEADNPRTGDSDSTHGFRNHQVFFNAVHQFKLGFKPGAWRDEDGTQHFEASKGYYLGYYRWYNGATSDIGLPGANAQYKRLLSNHLRMAMLIHADEARKAGGIYFNENFTLSDLALWRHVINWADPAWAQADEALLAELKSSLQPPLTAAETDDRDGDGQMSIVETALGTSPDSASPAAAASIADISPTGALSVTFTRARTDYSYIVEASSDLSEWTVIATNPGTIGVPVTVEDNASSGLPRRFVRLRIINARP